MDEFEIGDELEIVDGLHSFHNFEIGTIVVVVDKYPDVNRYRCYEKNDREHRQWVETEHVKRLNGFPETIC